MGQIAAIIFDCDGTLVDSEGITHEILIECLAEEGAIFSVAEVTESFRGMKPATSIAWLEERIGRTLPENFIPELRRRTVLALHERLQPMEGAIELVRSLTLPMCVASTATPEKIELSLSLTGLLPFFQGRIFSSYEVGSWKPEPDLFLHAARTLNVPPEACAVVVDSRPGIQAGLAAGMQVFALLPEREDHKVPENVRVVRHLSELRAFF